MKPTLRKFSALALLLGSLALSTIAKPGPHGGFHQEERAYLQATVLPVLRQQRQKLERELAPADQLQVASYRAQLKELAQREQALRQAARAQFRPAAPDSAAHHRGWPAPSAEQLAVFAERREVRHQVAQLAQKYRANITRLAAEIQPQQTQWVADLRAMLLKNRPADAPAFPTQPQDAATAAASPRPPASAHFGELHHLLRGAAFLLLAPGATELAEVTPAATALYPNPVAPTSQLQYELKKAGPVTVQVLDKDGNALRTVLQTTSQAAGPHTEALDLGDLPSGTYFYQLKTSVGTETKRFVKE